MTAKAALYIILTLLSAYTLSGINYTNFFKKNKIVEARLFIILLSLAISYLITNFIVDFLNFSKIV